jgi:hypothetical protein
MRIKVSSINATLPQVIAKYTSLLFLALNLIYDDVIVGYGPPFTNPLAATNIM